MIKRIVIENFKGIGPRTDIHLRPVTLLFGPNSAGKSTILHAIHYAHEVLESSNPDVGHTRLGGDIDLGGFINLVHDHDLDLPVILGFEFEPEPEGALGPIAELLKRHFSSVEVEIRIRYSSILQKPLVDRFLVYYEGEPLAELGCGLDGADVWLTNINIKNSVLGREIEKGDPEVLDDRVECLLSRRMALPRLGTSLFRDDDQELYKLDDQELYKLIDELMVNAGSALLEQLERFRYVGPLRQAPARNYLPPKRAEEARWAHGLGAWDALVLDQILRRDVSTWLGNKNHLNTGYSIEWFRSRELDEETFSRMQIAAQNYELDETFLGLTTGLPERGRLVIIDENKNMELAPCDLGEGIAQVVPVVTAALSRTVVTPSGEEVEAGLVAIEQPELHIHPRMQVVLGDLFLSQCTERQFLIETHSEHIMLRLLRRVRETAEKELTADAPEASIDTVGVYYVEPVDGTVKLTELRVSEDGEFLDSWPKGFFDERLRELL